MLEVELKVLEGRQQGKTIPLNVRQFLIGREQDCHLRPNSDLVSRHHCVFTIDDYAVRLRDLGSTNGTLVNGERLQGQVVLKAGDHVSVGKLSFEIVVKQAAALVAQPVGGKPSGTAPDVPAPSVEPDVNSSDTSLNVTDTVEVPAPPPTDDTAVIDAYNPNDPAVQQAAAQQPAFLPPNPYQQPAYGMPPGYPMPGYMPGYPPGYPQMPGYPPPGYGVPPGYPGYGMQPMMPGYGMPQQQQSPPPDVAAAGSASRTIDAPPVMLPDPDQTGARAPAPPPPPPPIPEGQATDPGAVAAGGKNPSDAAADIIRNHRTRRPT